MIQVADVRAAHTAPPEWVRNELGGATGNGIRVAVLDSGWDRTIDDPRVLPGVGFVDPDDDFALARNDDDHDVLGHGTACADVILGVAPDARIIPVKVFGNTLETSPGTLQTALSWAMESGVQVINVSLGTRLEDWLHRLYHTCEMARRQGIIIVAAGHNANDWSYPAIFENVIGVAAARFGSPYDFHYRAEEAMECVGWGVDRPVLWVGGERVVRHGTSFAAPGVAGIVALILERHPGAKIEDVRQMLARFALPGGGDTPATPASLPQPVMRGKRNPDMDPPAPARKPRKRAAAPAKVSDSAAPSKSATKSRKRAAAPVEEAQSAPAKKPRKRAAVTTSDPAVPAKAASKPRKPTTADSAAPAKSASKARKQAVASDSAAPAKAASKTRKPAAADSAPPAKAASKARKQAAGRKRG